MTIYNGFNIRTFRYSVLLLDLFWIIACSLILRIILIIKNPAVYGYDAYLYLLGISSEYPLFTGFLKILISLNCSVFTIRIIFAIIASLACAAFYLFVRRISSNTIARITVVLMCIYPSFLVYSLVPYTESLFFVFFSLGLWFYEKERRLIRNHYAGTGIFLGLACLIRYEAFIMLFLIFGGIIYKQLKGDYLSSFISDLLKKSIIFLWGPLLLILYKQSYAHKNVADKQISSLSHLMKNFFSMLSDLFSFGFPNLLSEIVKNGLFLPMLCFFIGLLVSILGCIFALKKAGKTHLLYIIFIFLAITIQLLPIGLTFLNNSGRIVHLRRHGMIPIVFLIFYFSLNLHMISFKLSQLFLKKRLYQTLLIIFLIIFLISISFKTTNFILKDYQKLYRSSYIRPCWIGSPGDVGTGIIISISEKILKIHLSSKNLKQYKIEMIKNMSNRKIEEFIKEKQIKYAIIERNSLFLFTSYIRNFSKTRFKRIANVGGWLFIYTKEDT